MKQAILGAMVVLVSACGADKADAFREGLPRAKDVSMKVPSSSSALTAEGTRRDGLEGQTAELYKLTRGVTLTVNGGTAAVLNLVEKIVSYPATTVTQDSAVWGPHTEPLSPNTWKLTVTRTAADVYDYVLEGKAKQDPDTAFKVVLSGTHHHLGTNVGTGTFAIDFNEAFTLPENDGNEGLVTVAYTRPTLQATMHIDADFVQVRKGQNEPKVDAQYRYVATPGQGGSFEFQLQKDFVAGAAIEDGKVKSRWLESGAGRSDARISGGDLNAPVTLTECWDAGFLSRFLDASYAPSTNYGQVSLCAFATAEYPAL